MAKAGIDTSVYKAHSTRAAVTSAAKGKQVPIETIFARQVGVVRAPLLGFTLSPSKTLPKISGMSYCIIAVNVYDKVVFDQIYLSYCYC